MHFSGSNSNVNSAFYVKFLNTSVCIIFRVGGRENFFHCERCGMLLNSLHGSLEISIVLLTYCLKYM